MVSHGGLGIMIVAKRAERAKRGSGNAINAHNLLSMSLLSLISCVQGHITSALSVLSQQPSANAA